MPSTVIRHFSYEPDTQQLRILFRSGRRYTYHDVPPQTYAAMSRSFSKGEYFNRHIRDHYRFDRDAPAAAATTRATRP